jgi:hypothetical protein
VAGTFIISEEHDWHPSGSTFDIFFIAIRDALAEDRGGLREDLRLAVELHDHYFDLRLLKNRDFHEFLRAAGVACKRFRDRGPKAVSGREAYEWFVTEFSRVMRDLDSTWRQRVSDSRIPRDVTPLNEFRDLGIPVTWKTVQLGWDGIMPSRGWTILPCFRAEFRGVEIAQIAQECLKLAGSHDECLNRLAHVDPVDSREIDN